ncbi:MAG: 16S rRNA (cytidine(1402)-2'-O)-methyltransferase [Candidatus Omnitrophota bacterium]
MDNKEGTLYVTATPIGNLKDITLRALEILKEVDLIACEDTRKTAGLLSHYGIQNKLISYFEYNKVGRSRQLIDFLKQGQNIALVTDAGTPGISDPGFLITRLANEENIKIVSVPGPCAFIAALSISGVATDRFIFEGFLPPKQVARRKKLAVLKEEKCTLIFYESTHRLLKALTDIKEVFGDIVICVAKELTKLYEDIKKDKVSELLNYFIGDKVKGEFVIIIPKQKKG